ncbi:alpha beta-hydrolase [Athelia psychrophila]|uniref:Carboxypeptidase n=1 Tax=Athelia psychrophila TaxID=1759441 RepID=A0A166THL0_9AGAM|nr:alpha beta-hydrolase [Fibularhizoctonia sp. CBS 109695]
MPAKALLALLALACSAVAQSNFSLPSTWPQVYPGQPNATYGPTWQSYFEVTDPLPNITWCPPRTLPRSFAGNMPVQRAGHPNDTLFFWGFEKENGSLTASAHERLDEPWGIWLNGGPGSSSMAGLTLENGPIHINDDYSISANNYSWDTIADYVWIDQPVGTGWSTADATGYVADEDQMGIDFFNFLDNLVKVFPSLAKRPLHLTGESYAGTYIPYITKTYFGLKNPPVNLAKIAIGDGTLGSGVTFEILPVIAIIETYPQLIGYDTEVYSWFKEQEHLCGYDLNLTYPQTGGHFPDLQLVAPTDPNGPGARFKSKTSVRLSKAAFVKDVNTRLAKREEGGAQLQKLKRDLTGRANGTIDSWYGCDLYNEVIEYAVNYTYPWNLQAKDGSGFDVYNIPDALFPAAPQDPSVFLNDNRTRTAIHAPTSFDWVESIEYPFGNGSALGDPSVEPMAFLSELATNATKHNVGVVIYSGNDDSLVSHRGSEVVIQNTTFGGIQGFTRKPSTPWYDLSGTFAGIIHQERNWTYALVKGAGHLVPFYQPQSAYALAQQFIFGSNRTGFVSSSGVVGGESKALSGDILPEADAPIFIGSAVTQSSVYGASATVAAWNAFIATAAPTGDLAPTTTAHASSATRPASITTVPASSTAKY